MRKELGEQNYYQDTSLIYALDDGMFDRRLDGPLNSKIKDVISVDCLIVAGDEGMFDRGENHTDAIFTEMSSNQFVFTSP